MIVVLFIAYSYSSILWRFLKNKWNSLKYCNTRGNQVMVNVSDDFELASDGITYWENGEFKFSPPVYIQRYAAVKEKLDELGPFKKVVDLGCAELKFFNYYLRHLKGLEEVLLIDQDEELLKSWSHSVKPITSDYLKPRDTPLLVKILQGNASVPDNNCFGTQAVVAIELIEHMFPPDLEELPYTLFGIIHPEVVIITTPNSDFNVLFKLTGFRHLDHKFEWSRQQFKDWVENIETRFPEYSQKLYGIGAGPEGTLQYGTCSQMVVFRKKLLPYEANPFLFKEESYKLILEIEYPFRPRIKQSIEEKVKYDAEKFIYYAVDKDEYLTDDLIEIPLNKIMKMVAKHTDSQQILQEVLESNGWKMKENNCGEKCVVLPSSGIPYSSSSSECLEPDDHYSNIYPTNWQCTEEESWSEPENLDQPVVSDCSSHLVSRNSDSTGFRDDIGFESVVGIEPVVESLVLSSTKKNDSSFMSLNTTCNVVESQISREVCQKSDSKINSSNFNGLDSASSFFSTNSDKLSSFPVFNSSIDLCTGNSVQYSHINSDDLSFTQDVSCHSVSESGSSNRKVLDSVDPQLKIENESFDQFDESLISSLSNSSKKDVFPAKRSLELPLDSLKLNLNGNFEANHSLNQKQLDSKVCSTSGTNGCQCTIKSKGQNLGSSDIILVSGNSSSSNQSSFMSNGLKDICCLTSDFKDSLNFDCSEKLEISKNQNQTGINRCLSLQYIKEKEGTSKSNRFSLCCEKENINICDIFKDNLRTKSCGHSFDEVVDLIRADTVATFDDSFSQSKAADSGYPNTSDRDMDMDLTPEQVDELLSENESSLDEREEDEERGGDIVGAAPIQFIEHVENGDVANNNRDGEGNNLDQVEVGLPLHFNQLIQEEGDNAVLDELPPPYLCHNIDSDSENEDKFMSCGSTITDTTLIPSINESISEVMTINQGWIGTSTPCQPAPLVWRPSDAFSIPSISSSSVSLIVHPSSDSSYTMYNTIMDSSFPPWLLNIEPDVFGEQDYESLAEPLNLSSYESIQAGDDWSGVIVPGDLLGGGEPQSHPDL